MTRPARPCPHCGAPDGICDEHMAFLIQCREEIVGKNPAARALKLQRQKRAAASRQARALGVTLDEVLDTDTL